MLDFRIFIEDNGKKGEVIYSTESKMLNVIHPSLKTREKIREFYGVVLGKPDKSSVKLQSMESFIKASTTLQARTKIKVTWDKAGPTYSDFEIKDAYKEEPLDLVVKEKEQEVSHVISS